MENYTIVGSQVESVEGLESQPTEVAGSVTTHPQLLPEGGHSFVGGHGSIGSVSSSSMGVTLGYPSGHPDPHSSIIASVVESQSTVGLAAATGISTATDDTPTGLLARQPPIGIETAAATNPTLEVLNRTDFITARCYASAVLAMALCLPVRPFVRPSVRHKSEFY